MLYSTSDLSSIDRSTMNRSITLDQSHATTLDDHSEDEGSSLEKDYFQMPSESMQEGVSAQKMSCLLFDSDLSLDDDVNSSVGTARVGSMSSVVESEPRFISASYASEDLPRLDRTFSEVSSDDHLARGAKVR